MTPTQVLEEQLALRQFWLGNGGDAWIRMQEDSGASAVVINQAEWEIELLGEATTYYVTPNMQHLVEHAARELSGEQAHQLASAGAPTPTGFLLLAHGIPVTREEVFPDEQISVITWEVDGAAVRCMTYSSSHPFTHKWKNVPSGLVMFNSETWEQDGYEEYFAGRDMLDLKLLAAFWHLSQQRVAVMHTQRPTRQGRRKLERRGFTMPPEVQVVVLRKEVERPEYDPDAPHMEVIWSHRWPVTGHWREQRYPSEGPDVVRPKWIEGYIKGPEHLPLVIKDRVFKLAR